MRKYNELTRFTTLRTNKSYEAYPIEVKISKILQNNEPIEATAPTIFTDRKDGVLRGYDIRTDRFDIALEAMDKITGSHLAKREEFMKLKKGGLKESGETPANGSDNGKAV